MLRFLDRWLEKKLLKKFSKKRLYILDKTLNAFVEKYPNIKKNDLSELCERLEKESIRVYKIVDRSLCRAGILRSKYTFLITGTTSVITIGSLGAFTSGAVLPFISPVASAFFALIASLSMIEINYHQRVKAGYDSVVELFIHERLGAKPSTSTSLAMQLLNHHLPQQSIESRPLLTSAIPLPSTTTITTPPDEKKQLTTCEEHIINIRGFGC